MIDDMWNSFLFTLKRQSDNELLEIAKNSTVETEILATNLYGCELSCIILIDRIYYEQFETYIYDFTKLAESHFLGFDDGNGVYTNVEIKVKYEPFVDWDAIRGIETKDSFIERVMFEKRVLLALIEGKYLITESKYIETHSYLLNCSKKIGIDYPNKMNSFDEINAMYYQVASGNGSWQARREYVRDLYKNITYKLEKSIDDKENFFELYEPTGWAAIDRDIKLIKANYYRANSAIEYKSVANMVRDILIKVAQEVYIDRLHHPNDFPQDVSKTDFKRMIDGYFSYKYSGDSKKEYRLLARKTMDVVSKLVHSDSTEKYHLTLCMEVSLMLARLVKLTEVNIPE